MKTGDVTKPIRTPSGFHIIKLNEMRGNAQVIVNQVHARHILIKPNELQDDATVRAEAGVDPRPHRQQGRELHRRGLGGLGRSGLLGRRRRSRLGRSRHLRARVRKTARAAAARRNQPAVPHAVRLAHHPVVRPSPVRHHRRTSSASAPSRRCAKRRPTRKRSSGCGGCATRRTSSTSSEHGSQAIAVTAGEPAGIGPDLCLALAGLDLPSPLVDHRQPRAARRACASARARRHAAIPIYRAARRPGAQPAASTSSTCHSRRPAWLAGSIRPTRGTCSRCWIAPSTAVSAASSLPWSRRPCRRA